MANKIIKAFYTTIDDVPLTGATPKIWIYEETSSGTLDPIVENVNMSSGPIPGSYIYLFTSYDSAKTYHTYSFANNVNAVSPYYMGEFSPQAKVNPSDIWNAPMESNSSVTGSFGAKISQYGGVSHVIETSRPTNSTEGGLGIDKETKKAIDSIKTTVERIDKKQLGERVVEVVRVEKVPVPSIDTELISDLVVEGLADIRDTFLDTVVEGLADIKNNK